MIEKYKISSRCLRIKLRNRTRFLRSSLRSRTSSISIRCLKKGPNYKNRAFSRKMPNETRTVRRRRIAMINELIIYYIYK